VSTSQGEAASEAAGSEVSADAAAPKKLPRWRRILVGFLVVLGCILAPISIATVWIHGTLLNTDQYVSTIGPLAHNSDVQHAIATRVSNELVESTDLEARVKNALPPRAGFIAPAVTDAVHSFVHGIALKIVQSPRFAQLWENLNRRAHSQIVAVLRGNTPRIKTSNGEVAIDLTPIIQKANAALEQRGVSVLNSAASGGSHRIVLFQSKSLKQVQGAVRFFDDLVIVLPILTVLLFAVAIALSGNRRRTLLRSALGVAAAMVILLTIFNLARTVYLNALPASVNQPAAGAVYDQLLSFLRTALRAVLVGAVIVAIAAWLAGPGRLATRIREGTRNLFSRAPGKGAVSPKVAEGVRRYRTAARVVIIAVGLILLALLSHPGPWAVLAIALVVLVLLGVVELLAREAPADETASTSTPSSSS